MANKQQDNSKQSRTEQSLSKQGMPQQNMSQQSVSQQGGSQQQSMARDVDAGRERNSLGQTEQQASYWREQYQYEPYVAKSEKYDDYAPAYRTGYEGRSQYAGQRFDDVEADLRRDWENTKGSSKMGWDKASQACRAAWDRADQFTASSMSDRQQR